MTKYWKMLLLMVAAGWMTTGAMAETTMLLDSIVDFSSDGQPSKKEAFLYDASGHTTMWYQYSMSGDQWSTLYTYQLANQYDAQGRVSRRNESLNTGSGWVLMNRTDYTYDEQGRLQMESRWSLSAVGNTWTEISRHVYQYGADDAVEQIWYQLGGGEAYLSYILVPEESTPSMRVMDIYWTGYEEDGAEGQRIYYFSEHEIQPSQAIDQVEDSSPAIRKIIYNGQVYILQEGKTYLLTGQGIE